MHEKNQSYGFIESNFSFVIEPENGKSLFIEAAGMEPEIILDETKYICKLGDPSAAGAKNPIAKIMHLRGTNRVVGPFLGYKWIYVYER